MFKKLKEIILFTMFATSMWFSLGLIAVSVYK